MIEGELHEKCAVAAVVNPNGENAAAAVYDELFAMQHRGAEASGIVASDGVESFNTHRAPGLVIDVYDEHVMHRLTGGMAIGHNRYSTNGDKHAHLQPAIDEPLQLAFAHNGNLPDAESLRKFLDSRNVKTARFNDSEQMELAIAAYISEGKTLPEAVEASYEMFEGAFSCVAMHDGAVVAFRDPFGIRPLSMGSLPEGGVVFSSETCGLDIIGAEYYREVQPGEMVIVDRSGEITSKKLAEGTPKLDMFELVYFARSDSYLYGNRVDQVRRRFGAELAAMHPLAGNKGNTLVIPVPDTSVPSAERYAQTLGFPHSTAIVKNRFIGRTFMTPGNTNRHAQLKRKHNFISEEIEGRHIILVDDSIVRGSTLPGIIKQARGCGALSVSVLIGSPPVRFPDHYGIDTPDQSELIAARMTVEKMRRHFDADYLGFLSVERMVAATGLPEEQFNLSCFTGFYPIDIGRHARRIKKPVSMQYAA